LAVIAALTTIAISAFTDGLAARQHERRPILLNFGIPRRAHSSVLAVSGAVTLRIDLDDALARQQRSCVR
jgi:hypothetical protein